MPVQLTRDELIVARDISYQLIQKYNELHLLICEQLDKPTEELQDRINKTIFEVEQMSDRL